MVKSVIVSKVNGHLTEANNIFDNSFLVKYSEVGGLVLYNPSQGSDQIIYPVLGSGYLWYLFLYTFCYSNLLFLNPVIKVSG